MFWGSSHQTFSGSALLSQIRVRFAPTYLWKNSGTWQFLENRADRRKLRACGTKRSFQNDETDNYAIDKNDETDKNDAIDKNYEPDKNDKTD